MIKPAKDVKWNKQQPITSGAEMIQKYVKLFQLTDFFFTSNYPQQS